MKTTNWIIGIFLMLLPLASKAQECDLDLMALVVPQTEQLPQEVQEQVLNRQLPDRYRTPVHGSSLYN
ncbi:MAG: hypothetical protein LIP00_12920 [Parabacteroides sp.]|nr:hypothetical protein [Parabacteroides sp.]